MEKIIIRTSTYSVKGTKITFDEKIKINSETNEEIFDPILEQENDIVLYNKYRKINNLLLPEEIKAIREKFGVTQIKFAQILGLGDKTITRYENGSLQDLAQNNLIKAVDKNPTYFLELLKNNSKLKNELSEKDFEKLVDNVSNKIKSNITITSKIIDKKIAIMVFSNKKSHKVNVRSFNKNIISFKKTYSLSY